MNHGSLFSGIGGFDLAAEWMGWNNVFHCEWNEFGKKVLNYYWPKAISYDDITKTDFTIHRGQIDILTGGFPCQPYSAAGKRLGKEDDRHLWPEMLRAIREIQPTWVVGENVFGFINWNGGLVFDEVQTDLEAEGYEVQPYVLPAVSVNAPHRRDRVWFVAYFKNNRCGRGSYKECEVRERSFTNSESKWTREQSSENTGRQDRRFDNDGKIQSSTDTQDIQRNTEYYQCKCGCKFEYDLGKYGCPNCCGANIAKLITDTSTEGLQGGKLTGTPEKKAKERGEQSPRSATKLHKITDWQNFPTQSPVCDGDDGLSSRLDGITFPKWRNESIKAGGNAIVPQVVYQIFKTIEQYNNTHSRNNCNI